MFELLAGVLLIIALGLLDAVHDRRRDHYRRSWLRAVELLTASDQARDDAERAAIVAEFRARVLLEESARLGVEFEHLTAFALRLQQQEAERAAAAARDRESMAYRQIMENLKRQNDAR